MKNTLIKIIYSIITTLCILSSAFAQSGQYDIRIAEFSNGCSIGKFSVDIEVKASSSSTLFNMADQNYRFTFNPDVIANPVITQELSLSGFVQQGGTASFYDPHTLTGSIDSFVSYNVSMAGGDGYPLSDAVWTPIGRVEFDIIGSGSPFITLRPATSFPGTFISEKFNGVLSLATEGTLSGLDFYACYTLVEPKDDLVVTQPDTEVVFAPIVNDYIEGIGIPYIWSPITVPPSNGTATLIGQDSISYLPNPGFTNGIDSISYLVCNPDLPNIAGVTCELSKAYIFVGDVNLAGADQETCIVDGSTMQLDAANFLNFTGTWDGYGGLAISDDTDPQATFSDLSGGSYTLTWNLPAVPTNYTETVNIILDDDCVWPGDTDKSAKVNNFDLLNIGIGYGSTGPVRPSATTNWDGELADNWTESTPANNVNYKHLDADGNGIINSDDTLAIIQNWGLFYTPAAFAPSPTGPPIYFEPIVVTPGATLAIPILLGTIDEPVSAAYGLAYTIEYDESLIEPSSVWIDYSTSWIGSLNTNALAVQKDFYAEGMIQTGFTRKDMINKSGYGIIGTLNLTIKDDVLFAPVELILDFSDVYLADNQETEESLTSQSIVLPITPIVSSNLDIVDGNTAMVRPNPSSGQITVFVDGKEEMLGVSIYNVQGVQLEEIHKTSFSYDLDLSSYAAGMYWIEVHTRSGKHMVKLVHE